MPLCSSTRTSMGVAEQVRDHLIEAEPVPFALHPLARLQRDPASGAVQLVAEAVDDLREQRGQVHRLELQLHAAGADAGDVEQLADEALQAGDLSAGLVETFAQPRVVGPEQALAGVVLE